MATGDALSTYNAKRDFKRTAEPKGKAAKASGHRFVVQKHDATRLHWDFRLEMDGVLKSWAVTRGPSLDPADKRLSVRTEDHPIDYATFEGTIPEGEYGGGTVMLWDEGTWEPVGGKDPAKTIRDGHVHVILHGQRMKGEWLLVRMKPRGNEKRENWLLRKVEDAYAGGSGDLVDRALTSVTTGRTMAQIAEGVKAVKAKAKAAPKAPKASSTRKGKTTLPAFRDVELATLVDHVPTGSEWLHEVKYDGYRALVAIGGGIAKAYTRKGLDWSEKFAAICDAAATLPVKSALIDMEVVALDEAGRPSFAALQRALKEGGTLQGFAFDLLELDGEDLTSTPTIERKQILAALLEKAAAQTTLHYSLHITGGGEALFDRLCREGYEGVVSKRADAPYRAGRGRDWLKIKCTLRQEFVLIGWQRSDKAGRGLKSLLVGTRDNGDLRYAGRVGTGFDADMRTMLLDRMRPLSTEKPPASVPRAIARDAHWVKPELVAEIAFTEFTTDGLLRHPSFLGLRQDKDAREVTLERPQPLDRKDTAPEADPFGVHITHPDRVIDSEGGVTKGELATYYAAMADALLVWLRDRPVSLVRCPQGRAKQCFFQKHDSGALGDAVDYIAIHEKDGKPDNYILVNSGSALLTCVQMGTIEFHGWGARAPEIERPDRMVFDLDPDPGVDFAEVRNAALQLRDELAGLGLESFALASGGKGIHVIVPLDASAQWPQVKDFADRFARAMAAAHPKRFTANMRKAERKGRIFLDWLRNERGSTAVLPWSARARANMPVAVPLSWDEVAALENAHPFTVRDLDALLKRAASPEFADWGKPGQPLPDS